MGGPALLDADWAAGARGFDSAGGGEKRGVADDDFLQPDLDREGDLTDEVPSDRPAGEAGRDEEDRASGGVTPGLLPPPD